MLTMITDFTDSITPIPFSGDFPEKAILSEPSAFFDWDIELKTDAEILYRNHGRERVPMSRQIEGLQTFINECDSFLDSRIVSLTLSRFQHQLMEKLAPKGGTVEGPVRNIKLQLKFKILIWLTGQRVFKTDRCENFHFDTNPQRRRGYLMMFEDFFENLLIKPVSFDLRMHLIGELTKNEANNPALADALKLLRMQAMELMSPETVPADALPPVIPEIKVRSV